MLQFLVALSHERCCHKRQFLTFRGQGINKKLNYSAWLLNLTEFGCILQDDFEGKNTDFFILSPDYFENSFLEVQLDELDIKDLKDFGKYLWDTDFPGLNLHINEYFFDDIDQLVFDWSSGMPSDDGD